MKKIIVLAVLAVLTLSACDTTKEKLGITSKAPDEFMVVPRAPLSLPPEYDYSPVQTEQAKRERVKLENLTPSDAAFVSKFNNNN